MTTIGDQMFENRSGIEVLSPDHREFVSDVAKAIQSDVLNDATHPHTKRAYAGLVVVIDHASGKARLEAAGYGLKTDRRVWVLRGQQVVLNENLRAEETVFAAAPCWGHCVGGFTTDVAERLLANPVFVYLQQNIAATTQTQKVVTLLEEVRYLQKNLHRAMRELATCSEIIGKRNSILSLVG